jgi:hypothetical protein
MVFTKTYNPDIITLNNSKYADHHSKGGWKWRIGKDGNSFWNRLWWRLSGGPVVTVDLPYISDYINHLIDANDVYFHYLPWLEENVGKYRIDWCWKLEPLWWMEQHAEDPNHILYRHKMVINIKLSKRKAHLASFIALKWGDQR